MTPCERVAARPFRPGEALRDGERTLLYSLTSAPCAKHACHRSGFQGADRKLDSVMAGCRQSASWHDVTPVSPANFAAMGKRAFFFPAGGRGLEWRTFLPRYLGS